MKFLAFVDMHQDIEDFEVIKKRIDNFNPDFIVCLGDFTFFSHNINEMLNLLNKLEKQIYVIHGNHEDRDELKKECEKYDNIEFTHKKLIKKKESMFLFYGGGGFDQREREFSSWIKKNKDEIKKEKNLILCTHAPPLNSQLDKIGDNMHVGVKDFEEFIINFKPILAISGHIHESYKAQEIKGNTLLVNPGGDGEIFEL